MFAFGIGTQPIAPEAIDEATNHIAACATDTPSQQLVAQALDAWADLVMDLAVREEGKIPMRTLAQLQQSMDTLGGILRRLHEQGAHADHPVVAGQLAVDVLLRIARLEERGLRGSNDNA